MTRQEFINLVKRTGLELKYEFYDECEGHFNGEAICGYRLKKSVDTSLSWCCNSLIIYNDGHFSGKWSNKVSEAEKLIYEELARKKRRIIQKKLEQIKKDFE